MKRKPKRERTIGGSINPAYTNYWYALCISIVKRKSADESLYAMGVVPNTAAKNVKRKRF